MVDRPAFTSRLLLEGSRTGLEKTAEIEPYAIIFELIELQSVASS